MLELKNVSFEVTEENNRKEIIYKPPSFRFQFLKNLFPQSKYKFTQYLVPNRTVKFLPE